MRRLIPAVAGTLVMLAEAAGGGLDAGLIEVLDHRDPTQTSFSVLVHLTSLAGAVVADPAAPALTRAGRHEQVVRGLQERATAAQADLLAALPAMRETGEVLCWESLWLANCVLVQATPSAIELIAARGDVEIVYYDAPITGIAPQRIEVGGGPRGGPAQGLEAINAPAAWALGYRGEGILVATIDTGVDAAHPALSARWAGVANPKYDGHPEWAWFDPLHLDDAFPYDLVGHGTHTMGTVCGGSPGDTIGVAPNATWISAAPIDRIDVPTAVSDAILSLQWMVDPDGDPATVWDVPHVCSNSWGLGTIFGYPECDELFWSFIDACEAAGIVMTFAAGNDGGLGLIRPADRATDEYSTFSVAAVDTTDPTWPIAPFSSLGPSFCTPDGSAAIKPDVSGPGIAVWSAQPGGGYIAVNGTSVAAPHINGVAALIRQACPDLTVNEVKQIMYDTAVDLGAAGKDNSFGYGMADAAAAVQRALDECGPSPPRAEDVSVETPVDAPVLVTLAATDSDGPDPLQYRITSLPAAGNTLTDPGNEHVITASELPYTLIGSGNVVRYAPNGLWFGIDAFTFVADDGGTPPDGGPSEPATVSVLVSFGAPSITTTALPEGFVGFSYGQVPLRASLGQPALSWSVANELSYGEQDLGTSQFAATGVGQGWHDDDGVWQYTLPFPFRFFGVERDDVWISSNGLLDFTSADADWSNTDAELVAHARIAVLWDDLRTDAVDTDVFIDESVSDAVTIRWQAITYDTEAPVNCACTLFADGRIRLHYGDGNAPVTPTVGISAGDGVHALLAVWNGMAALPWASTLEFAPPTPLPDGITVEPDGRIVGAPTEAGTFEPRFRVTDSLGRTDDRTLTLVVNATGRPGDITGPGDAPDGVVDALDMLLLLAGWGDCGGCPGDLTLDGAVDALDLLLMLSGWGG